MKLPRRVRYTRRKGKLQGSEYERLSTAAAFPNERRELVAAEEFRPAECGCIELVIADVGIGTRVEQHAGDADVAVLDRHVQRRVIASPHHALGVDVDA